MTSKRELEKRLGRLEATRGAERMVTEDRYDGEIDEANEGRYAISIVNVTEFHLGIISDTGSTATTIETQPIP